MNAIILAGDDKNGVAKLGISNKAFLKVHGRIMVDYVVDGLRASDHVDKISIVGPVASLKEHFKDRVDYYFEAVDCIFENVKLGLEPFKNNERVLVLTSDVPMLTGSCVTDFVMRCEVIKADLCYPIVDRIDNERIFPGFKRTYVKLQDGTFTGGNIFYFNPEVVKPCRDFFLKAIENRKKPWKTGRLLGFRFLLMLLLGRLTINGLEKRLSELLKINAVAIISPYPELANDIDKISDLDMVEKYLKTIAKTNT